MLRMLLLLTVCVAVPLHLNANPKELLKLRRRQFSDSDSETEDEPVHECDEDSECTDRTKSRCHNHICVPCVNAVECDHLVGPFTGSCVSGRCEDCGSNDACDRPHAARCDAGKCSPCTADGQCARFALTPNCKVDEGSCKKQWFDIGDGLEIGEWSNPLPIAELNRAGIAVTTVRTTLPEWRAAVHRMEYGGGHGAAINGGVAPVLTEQETTLIRDFSVGAYTAMNAPMRMQGSGLVTSCAPILQDRTFQLMLRKGTLRGDELLENVWLKRGGGVQRFWYHNAHDHLMYDNPAWNEWSYPCVGEMHRMESYTAHLAGAYVRDTRHGNARYELKGDVSVLDLRTVPLKFLLLGELQGERGEVVFGPSRFRVTAARVFLDDAAPQPHAYLVFTLSYVADIWNVAEANLRSYKQPQSDDECHSTWN